MNNPLEREQMRELRGSLLRTARSVYADGGKVTAKSLHRIAGEEISKAQIAEAIQYVVDKGYLRRIAHKADALDDDPKVFYQLMVAGIDLLNGDGSDPGVVI